MKKKWIEYKPSPARLSVLRPCGVAIGCAALWSEGWLMYFDSYATGKRIQHLRKANGMTQEELAVKLNTSDRHLRNLERGEEASSIDLMAVSEKPILTFTIDFETAKRYRKANKMPHQFRRAAWTDLTVEVCL